MKPVNAGTVQAKVLAYLLTGHSLDLPKAIAMWGHVRLSDAIHKLRNKGHNIVTKMIDVPHSPVKFSVYVLSKEPFEGTPQGTLVQIADSCAIVCLRGEKGSVERVSASASPLIGPYITLSEYSTPFLPKDLEVVYD